MVRKNPLTDTMQKENDTQDNLNLAHKLPESFILGLSQPPILIIPTFQFLHLKTDFSVDWFIIHAMIQFLTVILNTGLCSEKNLQS